MSDSCCHIWTSAPFPPFVECRLCNERVDVAIALEDLSIRIAALESLTGGDDVAQVGAFGVRLRLRDGRGAP